MKILITNFYLCQYTGSELFTKGLALELQKRGHEVFIYSPVLGVIADEIRKKGITVTNNIIGLKKIDFDVIHAQHNTTAVIARSVFSDVPMIFMSHGVIPKLEQPPSIDLGIQNYLSVSEEVRNNFIQNHNISDDRIKLVRNFVDAEKFYAFNKVDKKPKNLLVLSNHYIPKVKEVVEKACIELDINVLHVGLPNNSVKNVEKWINKADIVVTIGRGVLESMACERNVIVFDMHGGDGMINEDNFFNFRKNSLSGRFSGKEYSVEDFKKEILKYNPDSGKRLRELVVKENGVDNVVSKLENVYKEAKNKKFNSKIKKLELFNEINFLEGSYDFLFKTREGLELIISEKDNEIEKQLTLNKNKNKKIKKQESIIQQKEQDINLIKQSKFWIIRNIYIHYKDSIKQGSRHPSLLYLFLNKRLKKIKNKLF